MIDALPLLLGPEGYQISRSVRLRSSASAYFNRTLTTPTNNKIFTWSGWVKIGTIPSSREGIFIAANGAGTTFFGIEFNASAGISLWDINYSGAAAALITNQVFRDPSSWYHIVMAVDTTQATAANRYKLYLNGSQITSFSSANYAAQNSSPYMNSAAAHSLASWQPAAGLYFDGYLTEINFIDGQALTPSSFGSTNTVTGVWQPIKYTGTYGTNGFYLNFSDNSAATAAAIGKDSSGNGNNWTPNNISVTSGVTYDSMIDVPTNYADGGNGRGNYAVLNPLRQNGSGTFAQGNLAGTSESGTSYGLCSTIVLDRSGKWYMEWTPSSNTTNWFGVTANAILAADINTAGQQSVLYYASNGNKYVNGTGSAYGSSYTTNTIGIAFDGGAGTVTFYRDNVSQGAITLPSSTVDYVFCMGNAGGGGVTNYANFGQRPFTYTPPSGYVALNTQNLPTPTISNGATVMAATLYMGTGSSQTIANTVNVVNFKPDLVWIKSRSAATNNNLFDSVRGTTNYLISNSTAAEATNANTLTAFGTTGFTLGSDASALGVNVNAATYVGWQWQAGQGSTSSNTSGSITSTVSVSATAGFSVATFTAQASGTGTVGHGLGVAPAFIITKQRATAGTAWTTYHSSVGNTAYLVLNTTAASATLSTVWNNTSPTSNVFTLGTAFAGASTMVAYCWAAVAGYSAFGSYTGNGSADGPFVYCGFRPRWIMIRIIDAATYSWLIFDTARMQYNQQAYGLYADLSIAEQDLLALGYPFDILSNGFKARANWGYTNANGYTYIYAAFAENPFKYSRAR